MQGQPSILGYRKKNYINYDGNLGRFSFCIVKEINKAPDEERIIHFTLTHPNKDVFAAYKEELRDITLTPDHLVRMGFHPDPETKIFNLGTLYLTYTGMIEGNDRMNLTYVAASMRVFKPLALVPNSLSAKISQEQYLETTVPVPFVHSFQNYCEDLGNELDFSVLGQ